MPDNKSFLFLKPCLALTRPVNVVIGGLSIFVGALVTGTIEPIANVLVACLSGGLIAGGANAINDYFDIEIDRRNKPYRPLPSNTISPRFVYFFSLALLVLGSVLGIWINYLALFIAVFTALLLYSYSAKLKRTVLIGNIAVSIVTGLAFVYGGVAVGRISDALIPAGFAFFFHLGREIIKDVEDMKGDSEEGVKTLPIRYGVRAALSSATAIYILLIILTVLPYLAEVYNQAYLIIVIAGVDSVLLFTIIKMWRNPQSRQLHFLSNLLKADMIVGLIAIFVGK